MQCLYIMLIFSNLSTIRSLIPYKPDCYDKKDLKKNHRHEAISWIIQISLGKDDDAIHVGFAKDL